MRLDLLPAFALALALAAAPAAAHEDHDHDEDHAEHAEHAHDEHGDDDDHVSELQGVRIVHAWTNATDGDSARVFMEIENGSGMDVTLTGGSAAIGEAVMLMGAPIRAGEDEPIAIDPFPIAAGSDMALEPATLFLMIDGLTDHLHEGESFEMSVTLDPIGEIEVDVAVEAEGAKEHSHAGHSH